MSLNTDYQQRRYQERIERLERNHREQIERLKRDHREFIKRSEQYHRSDCAENYFLFRLLIGVGGIYVFFYGFFLAMIIYA